MFAAGRSWCAYRLCAGHLKASYSEKGFLRCFEEMYVKKIKSVPAKKINAAKQMLLYYIDKEDKVETIETKRIKTRAYCYRKIRRKESVDAQQKYDDYRAMKNSFLSSLEMEVILMWHMSFLKIA